MSEIPWVALLATLLGGGAMGAAIKILYDRLQGQIQPVAQSTRIFTLFRSDRYTDLRAVVSVTHDAVVTEYRNLFVADLSVQNRGNRDYDPFDFGVDLGADKCVHVGWENPDQHHILRLLDEVSPSSPRSELKFNVCPFNRNDSYSLRLYLVPPNEGAIPKPPRFTSPHAVRFVDAIQEARKRDELAVWIRAFRTILVMFVTSALVWLFAYLYARLF